MDVLHVLHLKLFHRKVHLHLHPQILNLNHTLDEHSLNQEYDLNSIFEDVDGDVLSYEITLDEEHEEHPFNSEIIDQSKLVISTNENPEDNDINGDYSFNLSVSDDGGATAHSFLFDFNITPIAAAQTQRCLIMALNFGVTALSLLVKK
jgi:hypothetical protein